MRGEELVERRANNGAGEVECRKKRCATGICSFSIHDNGLVSLSTPR